MTPQEKAKHLYDLYEDEMIDADAYFIESSARKCALIAVDEILTAITFNMYDEDAYNKEHNYWKEVKQELENL